jgi:hypothetical protein
MNVLLIQHGSTAGAVRIWLRAEGLVTFCLAVFLYWNAGYSWGLFAILFLAPDVSFAGYLAGPRAGAAVYNAFHSYVLPLAIGAALLAGGLGVALPLIWAAHIGFDRVLGYGLKYPTSFGDTHLGQVGGGAARPVIDERAAHLSGPRAG